MDARTGSGTGLNFWAAQRSVNAPAPININDSTGKDVGAKDQNATSLSAVSFPLGVFLVGQFLLFCGVGALIPALPLYGKYIGLGDTVTGVVISAPAVAMLLLNYSAGRSSDTYGRKPNIVGGMLGIAAADAVTAMATSLPVIIVARFALGAGRAYAEAGERAFLTDLTARVPGNRGRIVGAYQAVVAVGFVVGPKIGGVLVENYGPASPFGAVALASGIAAVGYAWLIPETLGNADLPSSASMSRGSSAGSWTKLLRQPSQRAIAAAALANGIGRVAKVVAVPLFATDVLGASPDELGTLFSLWSLGGLVAVGSSGLVVDRLKNVSSDPADAARIVICLSQLGSAAGFFLAVQTHSLQSFAFATGLWSIGFGAAAPALETFTQSRAPPSATAEALALPKSIGDLVFIIGPASLGFANTLVPGGGMLVSAFVSVAASVAFWINSGGGTMGGSSTSGVSSSSSSSSDPSET
ncbi:MFS protein [Pycnococcus provasolii]